MSQPVKVSDALVLDARLTGDVAQRSIAGQIEFWARLGRALEPLLRGDQAIALSKAGNARPFSDCISGADSAIGRRRVARHVKSRPFPHYEPSNEAGIIIRIEANGRRARGRFVNRRFEPVKKAR